MKKESTGIKKVAETQEILQYLLPVMESTKTVQTTQRRQTLNPRTNSQIQHQSVHFVILSYLIHMLFYKETRLIKFIILRNKQAFKNTGSYTMSDKGRKAQRLKKTLDM